MHDIRKVSTGSAAVLRRCMTSVILLLMCLPVESANGQSTPGQSTPGQSTTGQATHGQATHGQAATEYFRLGTGGNGGTYLPIGSLIANAINKLGIKPDTENALIVLPQRSNGSVANLIDITESLLEGCLAQADTISQMYTGQIEGKNARDMLRTVGTLFLESLHLVVAADSGITEVSDLIDKRVSVDELGSGTQRTVETLLSAYGLPEDKYKRVYLKQDDSIDRMKRGLLDAFFVIAGVPLVEVKQLVDDGVGQVIGIEPQLIGQLAEEYPYLSDHTIPEGVYANGATISTLGVSAQLIVRADVDEETVYQIARTLWSDDTLLALQKGHPRGADISVGKALRGISIPLHTGARRYYLERGYQID